MLYQRSWAAGMLVQPITEQGVMRNRASAPAAKVSMYAVLSCLLAIKG
jgi:hypothetical protein